MRSNLTLDTFSLRIWYLIGIVHILIFDQRNWASLDFHQSDTYYKPFVIYWALVEQTDIAIQEYFTNMNTTYHKPPNANAKKQKGTKFLSHTNGLLKDWLSFDFKAPKDIFSGNILQNVSKTTTANNMYFQFRFIRHVSEMMHLTHSWNSFRREMIQNRKTFQKTFYVANHAEN